MKSLDEYGIKQQDWISYSSSLCSLASSIDYPENTKLSNRITELSQSYFNQWKFIVTTYEKLFILHDELNKLCDKPKDHILTPYDIKSLISESEFRDYAYLLIVSMKTFLDLFACLADIVIRRKVENEYKMTDFNKFGKSNKNSELESLFFKFSNFRDGRLYLWIYQLNNVRNLLIHRAHHLKPRFSFTKSDSLQFIVYKGTDTYFDIRHIEIGWLFDCFMRDIPRMEAKVTKELSDIIVNEKGITIEASFRFSGWITEYNYKEVVSK